MSDDYNPNEYRLGIYKSGLEVDPAFLKAGKFNITFECKPQRYFTAGDDPIEVTSGDTLTNPTYFESGPLLEVEGYGTIEFNGYSIELTDGTYGEITLINPVNINPLPTSDPYVLTQNFDSRLVAVGDTIELNDWEQSVGNTRYYGPAWLKANFGYDSSTYRPNVHPGDWSYTSTNIQYLDIGTKISNPANLYIIIVPDSLNLTAGTPSTFSASATFTFPIIKTSDSTPTGQNAQFTVSVDIAYDGNDTIVTTCTRTVDSDPLNIFSGLVNIEGYSSRLKMSSAVANSTETYLGHPTYIDCDLGEAYKIEIDEYLSLNSYIDLGSDLPELAPGSNTVTFDNTITQLKITPRWWKV